MKTQLSILFLFLVNALLAQTSGPAILDAEANYISLVPSTEVWVDSTGEMSLENIREVAQFQPLAKETARGQYPRVYWLRVPLVAKDSLKDWVLVMKEGGSFSSDYLSQYTSFNNEVDVFTFDNNTLLNQYRTGFHVPASQKAYPDNPRLNAVPFSIAAGDSLTLFVRVRLLESMNKITLGLELHRGLEMIPIKIDKAAERVQFWMGCTGILGLLSLFFFFFVRDRSYLLFSVYALFLYIHYLILHPASPLITSWFPEHPGRIELAWSFLTIGSFLVFTLFGRSFIQLRQISRWLDNWFLLMAGGLFISLVVQMGMVWNPPYISIGRYAFLFVFGVMLGSIWLFFKKDRLAKIFALGSTWLMLCSLVGILWEMQVLSIPFNPWPIGQMGMLIIYILGLAYKLQLNERAKAEAQQVLELDAVKSRFFANISHEFRTPLTLILGPLKKAQEQLPASEQEVFSENGHAGISLPARHVGMMRHSAERLQQLINQLLDLSKLENGSMQLQVTEGDVVKFLRSIVFSFESLAERRQVHFQTEFPPAGQVAFFDKDKLEKIVVNLLSNAFKYTPEKGKVAVRTVLDKGRLKVCVEDSGPGISQEDLDRIFERFYQVEGTEDQGTGIGLSLVKELVELHRGQISVESGKGKGTKFKVSLPVAKEEFAKGEIVQLESSENRSMGPNLKILSTVEIDAEHPSQEPKIKNQKPVLLIVEDNPDLRQFIAETVQAEYQIFTAANGKIGLITAIEKMPDLIISDVMMPEMDGFEMCETLKKDERTSHIPIMLLTAKAGQQHKVEGLETGADDYLTKPFDEKELLVRARNLVEQRRKLREHFMASYQGVNFKNLLDVRPAEIAVTSADERFLKKVTATIENNMDNEFFSVEDLASEVAFSRSQLHRKLKALVGKSPNELIREFRLARAKELLEKGAGNVSEVAMEVGYSSLSYFTRSFKQTFGVSPSEV